MFSLFQILNLVLIIVTAILIYKNRKVEKQKPIITLFLLVLCLFIVSAIFF